MRRKRKGLFMKCLIAIMFIGLIVFTIRMIKTFELIGSEPSTLIASVFAFCSAEGGFLAFIKSNKNKEI